ncbi:MAG: hypothetical protein RBS57_08715, partial [Desulforhabdus sp.]|nr:hypothetical protein [Desulforhabdus sp.]
MKQDLEVETLQMQLPYYELGRKREKSVSLDWTKEWDRFDARKLFDFDISSLSQEQLAAMRKRQDLLMDGNHAAL